MRRPALLLCAISLVLTLLLSMPLWSAGQPQETAPASQAAPSPPVVPTASGRPHVEPDVASALILQKGPIKYPDAARSAGIEGTVVLKVVVSESGDVKEVTVVSGDPTLAQAATESVRQWKYKPYTVGGTPSEMETQVGVAFHVKGRTQIAAPPLGSFRDNAYANEYFSIYYPLARGWVRETEVMRKKVAGEDKPTTYVLLAAVRIPERYDPAVADSSFTVLATAPPGASGDDCRRHLEAGANELRASKEGSLKGDITPFQTGGHDFLRGDFQYSRAVPNSTTLCAAAKDYLLLWNFGAPSRRAVDEAIATLSAMTTVVPAPPATESKPEIHVAKGLQAGNLIKKVPPVYPLMARRVGLQGTVRMKAVISKEGDVIDLEVLEGPIELVVSAVDAVREWKYRPYVLAGQPIAVQTEITVNYQLSR